MKKRIREWMRGLAAMGVCALAMMILVPFAGKEAMGAPEEVTEVIWETEETAEETVEETIDETTEETAEETSEEETSEAAVYTVAASEELEGGEIVLKADGKEGTSLTVRENTRITVLVRAHENYRIGAVIVGEKELQFDDRIAEYETDIVITSDMQIGADFIRQHTISVSWGEQGEVEAEPELSLFDGGRSGFVTADQGEKVKITADPEDYHRVEKVMINGVADEGVTGENFDRNEVYEREFAADQNYWIEVSFAPNRYRVTAKPAEHGTISVEEPWVDYGGTSKVTLTPDEGYTVKSVQVNGKDQEVCAEGAAEEIYFVLEDIDEHKEIEVRFGEILAASLDDFSLNREDALRAEGLIYVFAGDGEAVFTTEKNGMQLYDLENRLIGGGRNVREITVTKDTDIGRICLYYQAQEEWTAAWHEVAGVTCDTPLRIVMDGTAAGISLVPSGTNENDIYRGDVSVDISAEDPGECSGIGWVAYRVTCKEEETDSGVLYSYEDGNPIQNIVKTGIVVKAQDNNSSQVIVEVTAADRAGNQTVEKVLLDIDITPPQIRITFDNNSDNNGNGYFDAPRRALVEIRERSAHFDPDKAAGAVRVLATDAAGVPVEGAWSLGEWATEEDAIDPDGARHTAVLSFEEDANYSWSVSCRDMAGNDSGEPDTGDSKAPFIFTVDTTVPFGRVRAAAAEGGERVWDGLPSGLTFGFASREAIVITGEFEDETSAFLAAVEYYKVQAKTPEDVIERLSAERLDRVAEWQPFERLELTEDEQSVFYFRITDPAGNYAYLGTDGLTVDHLSPQAEESGPLGVTMILGDSGGGAELYGGDVPVTVRVEEPVANGAYSGLRTIAYQILNRGVETQAGTLYEADDREPERAELLREWSGEFVVDSELNNSNDVQILIYAQDNALNYSQKQRNIAIDITQPIVEVSYDNNEAAGGLYFNKPRTAFITVTERNFLPENVQLSIAGADGAIPVLSQWTRAEGTGNLDDTRFTAALTYSEDGDYTFHIACRDMAGNMSGEADYGNSAAPVRFTIDRTPPVVSVNYSNNDAKNGRYFSEARTATVVITEHNFDADRVSLTQTADRDGEAVAVPEVRWTSEGDVHTARLAYSEDGEYSLEVTAADLASNESEGTDYGESTAGQNFVIDQTIPSLTIGGVENGCVYSRQVIPELTFGDRYYDSCEIRLLRTRLGEKNADVTDQFIPSVEENHRGGGGTYDTFARAEENDGIYRLIVTVRDLAGNEETEEIVFALNRFGSVYVYDDYLISLIQDGGRYITFSGDKGPAITQDLVIAEYSPGPLLDGSLQLLVTRDGEAVDADYQVVSSATGAETSDALDWYRYVYTIAADNFAEDGVYRISLSSAYSTADSGKNRSASVPENSMDSRGERVVDVLSFTVDTTAPEIRNIANLEKEVVDAASLDIPYTIVDEGGLACVEVMVNGELFQRVTDFGENKHSYTGRFTLREDENVQTVRLVATDLAGNVADTSDDIWRAGRAYGFQDKVTVSTNFMVRWYANRRLFWGSVGAAAALGILFLLVVCLLRRRRKKP